MSQHKNMGGETPKVREAMDKMRKSMYESGTFDQKTRENKVRELARQYDRNSEK